MTPKEREALKLADALNELLESFEKDGKFCKSSSIRNELYDRLKQTLEESKEALAQPEQEPQKGGCVWCGGDCPQFECDTHSTWMNEPVIRRDLPLQPKEAEQEPVAWGWIDSRKLIGALDYKRHPDYITPLYTTPPQRKPLTDEQINEIADEYLVDYRIPAGCAWNFARDIEAAHNIKE